jgi:4'-phosphopantetheinyl transferase
MNERLHEPGWRPGPPLTEGAVTVWSMALASPPHDAVARWLAVLDDDERARADRFRFTADREIYIAAHALTRALLAAVGGLPAPAWRFAAAASGKPEIDPSLGRPRLRFNLSHTRGLVACAAGLDDDLGIDGEATDRIKDELELAEHFFAADEVSLLRGTAKGERRNTFFRIWTLKEAYIKATGLGLACPLDSFAFGLDPIAIQFRADLADDPAAWQFLQWRPTPLHLVALAVRRVAGPIRLIQRAVDQHEL